MGIDREDFSDTANWQTPQELPDSAPRGHRRARHRDTGRRLARRSRLVLAMARRLCLRHHLAWHEGGEIRAIYVPMRHPDTDNLDPARSIAGSRI